MPTINVSLNGKLLKEFDETIEKHGYKTRSGALSEAMRDFIDKLNERAILKMRIEKGVTT